MLTRMSTRPKASSAALTILSALPGSLIDSVEAIASPPAFLISCDDLLRRPGVGAGAVEARADVADHDARALLRHQQRNAAPDPAPRAGDDGDFSGDDVRHAFTLLSQRSPGLRRHLHTRSPTCRRRMAGSPRP